MTRALHRHPCCHAGHAADHGCCDHPAVRYVHPRSPREAAVTAGAVEQGPDGSWARVRAALRDAAIAAAAEHADALGCDEVRRAEAAR